jgi:hypothetical protein
MIILPALSDSLLDRDELDIHAAQLAGYTARTANGTGASST